MIKHSTMNAHMEIETRGNEIRPRKILLLAENFPVPGSNGLLPKSVNGGY